MGASALPISRNTLFLLLSAAFGILAFLAYDIHRTVSETQVNAKLTAALAAAQLAPRDVGAPRPSGFAMPEVLSGDAAIVVTANDGEVLASSRTDIASGDMFDLDRVTEGHISAQAAIAGDLGMVTVTVPHLALAQGLGLRLGALVGALLLLALVTLGRSRKSSPAQPEQGVLETVIDAVPYGLARWTEDGQLIGANPAFGQLLRIEHLNARAAYTSVTKSIVGRISARPVLDNTRRRVVEVEREDGTAILLDERPCPEGGFMTVVTDITERKAADKLLTSIREEQRALARQYHEEKIRAEAASRAKTCFLAHLSHDIRTPLNHIIGFADLIGLETYGPLGDEKYKTYLKDIRQSGERLLNSFAEILEYAELEGGRRELKSETVVLSDLVRNVASRFSSQASRAGLRLTVGALPPGTLEADRLCLNRMLDNLVENAIRFTPRGGEVRLAAWAAEDGVVLEISDTGIGMSPEQIERLSQPFAASDAAFTKTHEGVGLGIAIARAIAELSGGRLAIDSRSGVGTTIAISLPRQHETGGHLEYSHAQAA